ncbi:D-serine ammonia-lyase [Dethiosulfovibrio peptidovorans DSM 11002]|uniref:Probable D-serine dehydratase n=1 Tax=Dethiosulfovibrio peptidovorans DSM 11002 TaxID=469381 RepID=D2Z7T5_9BACT|nr:D-serine ammonia-lyase [Dethiosulfovibrio peptidovorans]EFC91532.1 D-serine ammonia-lyase [Dethiosulfovibrio peptidovorans DSM 11002]
MVKKDDALRLLKDKKPMFWENDRKSPAEDVLRELPLTMSDVADADGRLHRFAPYLASRFPETADGIIESPLSEAGKLKKTLEKSYGTTLPRLLLKKDNDLPVAGSIKARGGIHEILALAEAIALRSGKLEIDRDYRILEEPEFKELFSRHSVAVGSTGNLGISIGVMSAELGFNVTVHMSRDAKDWKKGLLRSKGVKVVEHDDDYSAAVSEGRRICREDKTCHFVDDENSRLLFVGYAVAALRLRNQLKEMKVIVDEKHPLRVYLPCGVGGAPGGIAFGLKQLYGDSVKCWFVEPTHAPCMALAMVQDTPDLTVSDYGIDGITEADGLAVGAPSKLIWSICRNLIDGVMTVEDNRLYELQYLVDRSESVKAEPSAAAGLQGPLLLSPLPGETAISWLTGGSFLPDEIYEDMLKKGRRLLKAPVLPDDTDL